MAAFSAFGFDPADVAERGFPDSTLAETARESMLEQYQEGYGAGVPMFHADRPLVERGFLDSLDGYTPEDALDHEDAFGVPEPPDTFKLERTEAGRAYLERADDPGAAGEGGASSESAAGGLRGLLSRWLSGR